MRRASYTSRSQADGPCPLSLSQAHIACALREIKGQMLKTLHTRFAPWRLRLSLLSQFGHFRPRQALGNICVTLGFCSTKEVFFLFCSEGPIQGELPLLGAHGFSFSETRVAFRICHKNGIHSESELLLSTTPLVWIPCFLTHTPSLFLSVCCCLVLQLFLSIRFYHEFFYYGTMQPQVRGF